MKWNEIIYNGIIRDWDGKGLAWNEMKLDEMKL